jgi:transposase
MTFAKSPAKLRVAMPDILENAEAELTPRMRNLGVRLWSEWSILDQQIEELNHEIEQIASSDEANVKRGMVEATLRSTVCI